MAKVNRSNDTVTYIKECIRNIIVVHSQPDKHVCLVHSAVLPIDWIRPL